MAWTIKYSDTARKQLKKIDRQIARRILDFMDERVAIADDPRQTGKTLTGPLGNFWRYRVGDYCVICDIQDGEMCVLVIEIGNCKDIYR